MKHLKAKLMASVGMLLVAIIMMSTASYAWFTISTAPEIANISANITANGNLEIALGDYDDYPALSDVDDSGKNGTWGNLIDLTQAFEYNNSSVITLKPIRLTVTGSDLQGTVSYPVYNLDGRIKELATLCDCDAIASDTNAVFGDVDGVHWLMSTYSDVEDSANNHKITVTFSDIYAFSVDYWMRSNTTPTDGKIHVTLASASDRANGSDGSQTGLGSYIDGDTMENITIAFRASNSDYVGWFLASRTNVDGTRADIVLRKATNTDGKDLLTFDPTDSSEAYIPLDQNKAMHVTMYVYLNGDELYNSDAYLALQNITINVQFEIEGLQNAMKVTVNQDNGRQ